MAAAPGDLGDFFKNKLKKKVKATNLNSAATAAKPEEKKPKKTDKDEEGWEEEQVTASTITRIEVVGNLKRDDDKKEEEESTAPAWGSLKTSSTLQGDVRKEKQFPSLAKSVQSSNINIDDGSDNRVNIKTSKNAFAALENADDEDGDAVQKRPKVISAAKVHKAQGERETVALQREVDKYVDPKKDGKKDEKKDKKDKKEDKKAAKRQVTEEEDEDDAEEADEDEEAEDTKSKGKKKKKDAKKDEEEKVDEEKEEDLQIVPDLEAAKAKYDGRRKLAKKDLPFSEMKEKANKPQEAARNAGGKKKKFANFDEDDDKPKLQYLPSDSD
jgi:hypothetical protein